MDNLFKKIAKGPSKEDQNNAALVAQLERYWQNAEGARKELDWKWFNYDLWVSGNHYAKWDKATQQIVSAIKTDNRPKVVINKVYTTLRAVRSYVMQNEPKAEVTPYNMTEQDLDQVQILNHYLSYMHDRLYLNQKLRASLWHALKYSVGFWQVLWNPDGLDGQGEVEVNVVDPYDLYIDPVARVPQEARFMVLAVRRNLQDVKEDPKYKDAPWDDIAPTKQLAASTLKSRLIQYEKGGVSSNQGQGSDTVIVKEFWYWTTAEEEQEIEEGEDPATQTEGSDDGQEDILGQTAGKKKKTRTETKQVKKLMLCTMVNDVVIRQPEDTGLNRFPFFRVCSDIEPLAMYGTGWVKHLIPVNRLLERAEASLAEYNEVVNKGRFIADKGAGVRVITNEHGQIIEKKPGREVTAAPVPPIDANAILGQITNARTYIEDIGAAHDAMLGRMPAGAHSGVAIEALQEGDSNNLSELTENTEEFLEDVYEYILYLASQKYQFARNVVTNTNTGEKLFISLIGESADSDLTGENQPVSGQADPSQPQAQSKRTVIPTKNIVDVKLSSYLAYTAQGRQQAISQLAQQLSAQGTPLPAEFILEAYEIGPIADILKQMKEEQQKQQAQQMQMQQQQQQMEQQGQMQMQQHQAQIQQQNQTHQAALQSAQQQSQQASQQASQPQPQGAGAQQAIAFIRLVLDGQKPDLPQTVSADFIRYLDEFIHSTEGRQQNPEFMRVLQQDRNMAALHLMENAGNVNGR